MQKGEGESDDATSSLTLSMYIFVYIFVHVYAFCLSRHFSTPSLLYEKRVHSQMSEGLPPAPGFTVYLRFVCPFIFILSWGVFLLYLSLSISSFLHRPLRLCLLSSCCSSYPYRVLSCLVPVLLPFFGFVLSVVWSDLVWPDLVLSNLMLYFLVLSHVEGVEVQ